MEASSFGKTASAATRDRIALRSLLEHPSQHLWVTFEDGCMWWCTVRDEIEIGPADLAGDQVNFWLTCAEPWSNHSIGGRPLVIAELPGVVTSTAGFRGTVCEPRGSKEILRIIRDEEDVDAAAAVQARLAYEAAIAKLVARLGDRDFEILVDLILSRTGWARLAKVGGVTEGIDIEAENDAAGEIAFVQVKSSATQGVLDDSVGDFSNRRGRYARMIFAVHTPVGVLKKPDDPAVQVWAGERLTQLVVKHGLGEWVAKRL
jgi:hypothetical protein